MDFIPSERETLLMRLAGSARLAPQFKHGDHICWLYESEDEHRAVLKRFLSEGLAQDRKVIYAFDNHSPATILGYLTEEGWDPRPCTDSGQLVLLKAADLYLSGGRFSPALAAEAWRAQIGRGLEEGYKGFYLTAEMTCALADPNSQATLLEFETGTGNALPDAMLTSLCQYDRRRFAPGFLLDVLSVHPRAIYGARVQQDSCVSSPAPESVDEGPEVLGHLLQSLATGGEPEPATGERPGSLEITEQKLEDLIDALVDSEQRYWAMGELLPFGVWACNPRGELIYASDSYLDMLGMTMDEAREYGWASKMPPEDVERILPAWRRHVQSSDAAWECELPHLSKDGQLKTILSRGAPVRNKDGNITSWVGINIDITDRKRAEEALQESEEKFRSIVEQSLDGILLIDESGNIVEWNHAQEEITGRKREEVIGRPAWDVHFESLPLEIRTEERRRLFEDWTTGLLQTGHAPRAGRLNEGRLCRPDGTVRYIQDITFPIQTRAGRMVCSMNRDVTERRLAQEARRESEARFRAMFSDAALGIALVDRERRVIDINPALQRMLGCTLEDFRDKTFLDITHPDDRATETEMRRRMLAGEHEHYTMEKRYVHKDGSLVWGRLTASLIRDSDGEPQYTLGMLEDITERKKAEDAGLFLSRVSEALAASLDFEATLQGVAGLAVPLLADCCAIDILQRGICVPVAVVCQDPTKEPMVRHIAQRFARTTAVPGGIDLKLAIEDGLLMPEVPEPGATDSPVSDEHLRMLREVGARSAMMVPLASRGRPLGAIYLMAGEQRRRYGPEDLALARELAQRAALAIDNAQLYSAEQEARAAAETAVQVRDDFLSMAAHELRTPITSLRGFAHLMVKQFDKEGMVDPDRLRRALEVIDEQSVRLTKLISQLLDVSQIEAGRMEMDFEVTDTAKLVNEVASRAQALSTQHHITVESPPSLLASVDALRIEQVITNLIDNAIKYSPKGGPIDVDVWQPDDGNFCIAVRDQGIGIQSHHRAGLFTRFYQAHKHGQFGGLGLGLYISREIVTMHGGEIDVEFPEEGGTRFVVTVPIRMGE